MSEANNTSKDSNLKVIPKNHFLILYNKEESTKKFAYPVKDLVLLNPPHDQFFNNSYFEILSNLRELQEKKAAAAAVNPPPHTRNPSSGKTIYKKGTFFFIHPVFKLGNFDPLHISFKIDSEYSDLGDSLKRLIVSREPSNPYHISIKERQDTNRDYVHEVNNRPLIDLKELHKQKEDENFQVHFQLSDITQLRTIYKQPVLTTLRAPYITLLPDKNTIYIHQAQPSLTATLQRPASAGPTSASEILAKSKQLAQRPKLMSMDKKSIKNVPISVVSKMAPLTPQPPASAPKIIKKPVEQIPEGNMALCANCGASTDKNTCCQNFKIKKLTPTTGLKGGGIDAKTLNKRKADKNALINIDIVSDNENEVCPIKRTKVDKCLNEKTPPPDTKVKKDSQTSSDASSVAESSKKLVKKLIKTPATKITHEDLIAYRDNFIKNSQSCGKLRISMTTIECRSVRIGSYKIVAAEANTIRDKIVVNICDKGICFELPHVIEGSKKITCALPYHTILSVTAHFKHRLPVLFIKTSPQNANWLREKLGMGSTSDEPFYYDPEKGGKTQQTITFLAEPFNESDISIIKKLFAYTLIELDHSKANNLLMEINPASHTLNSKTASIVQPKPKLTSNSSTTSSSSKNSNRTTRSSTGVLPRSGYNDPDSRDGKILLSSSCLSIGICLTVSDLYCLGHEQFLNDQIIDFWLALMHKTQLSEAAREKTHIFSTYFYQTLTSTQKRKISPEENKLSINEKRHARVKKWTKNVDIFEKDFIIIPINESLHWYLVVICYPDLDGVVNAETNEPIEGYVDPKIIRKSKKSVPTTTTKESRKENGLPDRPAEGSSKRKSVIKPMLNTSLDDETGEESDFEDESAHEENGTGTDSSQKGGIESQEIKMEEESGNSEINKNVKIKRPCILIFDSLAGESRSKIYSTLREYLRLELKEKKGREKKFTKENMPGCMPKVPQQPNHCDCGIYSIQYVESFFSKPITTYTFPINQLKEWFPKDYLENKRKDIYNGIVDLIKTHLPDNIQHVPQLTFSTNIAPKDKDDLEQVDNAPKQKIEKDEEQLEVDVGEGSS